MVGNQQIMAIISIIKNQMNCLLISVLIVLKQKPRMGVPTFWGAGLSFRLQSASVTHTEGWRRSCEFHRGQAVVPTLLLVLPIGGAPLLFATAGPPLENLANHSSLDVAVAPILGGLMDLLNYSLGSCDGFSVLTKELVLEKQLLNSWQPCSWLSGHSAKPTFSSNDSNRLLRSALTVTSANTKGFFEVSPASYWKHKEV